MPRCYLESIIPVAADAILNVTQLLLLLHTYTQTTDKVAGEETGEVVYQLTYLLSNICTKNYLNQATMVEIIVGGWVVSFFKHCV